MEEQLPSYNNLTPYYTEALFMERTARQIEKDFGSAGLELQLSPQSEWHFENLRAALLPHIEALMRESFEQLLNLLYRIDLPEQRIAQAADGEEPLGQAITSLVIQRELMKVLVREWMSQGGSGEWRGTSDE